MINEVLNRKLRIFFSSDNESIDLSSYSFKEVIDVLELDFYLYEQSVKSTNLIRSIYKKYSIRFMLILATDIYHNGQTLFKIYE